MLILKVPVKLLETIENIPSHLWKELSKRVEASTHLPKTDKRKYSVDNPPRTPQCAKPNRGQYTTSRLLSQQKQHQSPKGNTNTTKSEHTVNYCTSKCINSSSSSSEETIDACSTLKSVSKSTEIPANKHKRRKTQEDVTTENTKKVDKLITKEQRESLFFFTESSKSSQNSRYTPTSYRNCKIETIFRLVMVSGGGRSNSLNPNIKPNLKTSIQTPQEAIT